MNFGTIRLISVNGVICSIAIVHKQDLSSFFQKRLPRFETGKTIHLLWIERRMEAPLWDCHRQARWRIKRNKTRSWDPTRPKNKKIKVVYHQ